LNPALNSPRSANRHLSGVDHFDRFGFLPSFFNESDTFEGRVSSVGSNVSALQCCFSAGLIGNTVKPSDVGRMLSRRSHLRALRLRGGKIDGIDWGQGPFAEPRHQHKEI
jgi:hypothetical protein